MGLDVRKLQILLNASLRPSPRLRADGSFGPRTKDAVMRFQRVKGLEVDGVVGPVTWRALGASRTRGVQAQHVPNIPDAPWVRIAQAELGVQEDSSPERHNGRIVEYHQTTSLQATTDEVPWCSSFVNWAMIAAGHPGTNTPSPRAGSTGGPPSRAPGLVRSP